MGVELIRQVPGAEARVYPVSNTEFETFSLRSPVSIHIEFETGAQGGRPSALIFFTNSGRIRAERIKSGTEEPSGVGIGEPVLAVSDRVKSKQPGDVSRVPV